MTGPERLRSIVDRLRKKQASRAPMPTGGGRRTMEEAVNTGANARGFAMLAVKKPKGPEMPQLAAAVKKERKTY